MCKVSPRALDAVRFAVMVGVALTGVIGSANAEAQDSSRSAFYP